MLFSNRRNLLSLNRNLVFRLAFCLLVILLAVERASAAGLPVPRFHERSFTPKDAGQFEADVAVAWFDLAYALVRQESLTPPVAARTFAYLGVALYEALVPGMPGYQSLAGQLNELEPLPGPADHAYHWPVVANSALATTMRALLPGREMAIQALEADVAAQFRPALPSGVFVRSVARGKAIGQAIQRWANNDGYSSLNNCAYNPPTGAGLWTPTAPGYRPALQPCWGQMRPFLLVGGSECSPPLPPAYSEEPLSHFYREAWEVYTVVGQLTPEQLAVALYWADDPGATGTPPGHSISILSQILLQEESSLARAAEAYALVGIAVGDAFISCWWSKYDTNVLRPITYIRDVFGDSEWMSPVNTPPFPEYTSGHSVQSAAAANVLAGLFGEVTFTDHTHDARGFTPRTFTSFSAFAQEAAISRLYGGIHYRAAIDSGLEQGNCIARRVSALHLRVE